MLLYKISSTTDYLLCGMSLGCLLFLSLEVDKRKNAACRVTGNVLKTFLSREQYTI